MTRVFFALGSNVGDKKANVEEAIRWLRKSFEVRKVSPFYLTEPVGYTDQPWFVNCVVEAETELGPKKVLQMCQGIEKIMGRSKTIKDGPRTIDLDLLLYGDELIEEEGLTVPHQRMHERRFVLKPLTDIAPNLKHPVTGLAVKSMLSKIKGGPKVQRLGRRD